MFAVLFAKDSPLKGNAPDRYICEFRKISRAQEAKEGFTPMTEAALNIALKESNRLMLAYQLERSRAKPPVKGSKKDNNKGSKPWYKKLTEAYFR
jgi:hypothetical protein